MMKEKHADLLQYADECEYNIQKYDIYRLCVLYEHGGVYADIDIECYRSIDDLINERADSVILFNDYPQADNKGGFRDGFPRGVITNSIFYAPPKSKFLRMCLRDIKKYRHRKKPNGHSSEPLTTGPGFITVMYNRYKHVCDVSVLSNTFFEKLSKDERIKNFGKLSPDPDMYGMHWNICSWNNHSWLEKRVFIGYDSRESECYDVCKCSINTKTTSNVVIKPINKQHISEYNRPTDPLASTEFTYTRFLTPWLCEYRGWALFCDCDFVFLHDVSELFELADDRYAIQVCKHDYTPKGDVKMDGKKQTSYPRKNWSSLILWNCGHEANAQITPDVVNTQTGKYLHRFEWLSDDQIGSLPTQWNWLVGYYQEPHDGVPKALHYTDGGPWFENYKNCEYAAEWNKYYVMCSRR
jgi:hypothetical protein